MSEEVSENRAELAHGEAVYYWNTTEERATKARIDKRIREHGVEVEEYLLQSGKRLRRAELFESRDDVVPPSSADVSPAPASGGQPGDTGGHSVRVAIVVGLADLFFDYGQGRSAKELYHVYTELRVFAHPRANTRLFRRMTHWWHWKRS